MVSPGNVSVAAFKTERTKLFRKRAGLRPIPFPIARRLTGLT